MVYKQRSITILFCFAFLMALLVSSCMSDITNSEEPVEAAITETPVITKAPEIIKETEITPQATPTEHAGNIVIVHNAKELLSNMVSGRHIRLMPGGDYDLPAIRLAACIFYGLDNLTLEGIGETPVPVHTKNMQSVVMSFSNCSNITLINLELSHTVPVSPNNHCEGKVLAFYDNTTDITIKNCVLSGCGITGLYAINTTNLRCEDTLIRDCSMSIMDLNRLKNATFIRCTFEADNSQAIKLSECRDVIFADCLFTGGDKLPYIQSEDWSPFEATNETLYAKIINLEHKEHGILLRNSALVRYDYSDLFKQLKDDLSSYLPDYPFDINISRGETVDSVVVHMKTPVVFKNIQKEYQLCFDSIMLSMKDVSLSDMELVLEMGPIFTEYQNFNAMLDRTRSGEKISFWETSFIQFGDLDAGLINPDNNQYLSILQAREILLNEMPLPVSTNDYEPFVNIADVETGATSLIYDDGRLFYLFKELSYGAAENFGYDGFCIDAATGALNKFHDDSYVVVSSADRILIADVVKYLEKSGAVVPLNDWIKVQIYDDDTVTIYFGARLYFQLKITKTSEGICLEPYQTKSQFEGDGSSDITELPYKKEFTVKQLNDEYDLKWTFSEEMKHHFILGKTGNTLLVYGHDGGISGYHSDKYLYGLDVETGKKIWSVYGGYLGIPYVVSREKGKVYMGVKIHDRNPPRLMCLDMHTGTILWEQVLTELEAYSPMSVTLGDAVAFSLYSEEGCILKVLDETNGNLLWQKTMDKDDTLLYYSFDAPGILIRQEDAVKSIDWVTGQELWSIPDKLGPVEKRFLQKAGIIAGLDELMARNNQMERWMVFEDGYRYVNMQSGQIIDSILCDISVHKIMPLNHEYFITREFVKENGSRSKVKSFSLYSVPLKKELWSIEDDIIGTVLEKNTLYYITGSEIKSVNLLTGVVNWSKPFSVDLQESPLEDNHFIQPVIAEDKMLVSEQGVLFMIDPENGDRLYQVGDYAIENFMAGGMEQYYCSMIVIDGMLYLGSGSGKLSCLKIIP